MPSDAKAGRRIADLEVGTMAIVDRSSVVPYVDDSERYGIAVRTNDEIPEHIEADKHPVGVANVEVNLGTHAITGFIVDGRRGDLFTTSRLRDALTYDELETEDPETPLIVSYLDNENEVRQTANWYDRQPYMESLAELEEWLDEYYGGVPLPDREEGERQRDIGKLFREFGGKAVKNGLPIAASVLAPEVGIPLIVAQEVGPHAVKAIARYVKKRN